MADVDNAGELDSSSSQTPLDSLFSRDSEPDERESSSAHEADDKKGEKEEASQRLPADMSSPDEKPDDKKPKAAKKSDSKPEDKQDAKGALEGDESEKDTRTPEQKAEAEAKEKWEKDDNPYFKRFRDTQAGWQKEHQEKLQYQQAVQQLQQEMGILRKIADGTYDPEKDDPAKQIRPEKVATDALNVGKTIASRNAAISQFGEEAVNTRISEFNSLFQGHELINSLVVNADSPVHEAFRILDRYHFESKYGSDPSSWKKNISAEVEKELREKIKAEVTEELMGRVDQKNNTPRGLSSSRGSNGLKSSQNSKGKGPTPLKSLFS